MILPYLNYCCLLWGNAPKSILQNLTVLQKKIIRMIDDQPRLAHTGPIFASLKLLKIKDIAQHQTLIILHNILHNNAPLAINSLFKLEEPTDRPSRRPKHFHEPFTTKTYLTQTATWIGPRLWNSIIASRFPHINSVPTSKNTLKKIVKRHIIDDYE